MSPAWTQLPERGNGAALRLIGWVALRIGRPVGRALLYPITLYFLLTATAARRGSQRYLRRILGREPRWRDSFRHLHCFAATLLDRIYFLSGQLERFDIRFHNDRLILDQVASGQGCILLGSHLGSFEVLRALGITQRRLPLRILMNTRHNQGITRFFQALNPQLAQAIIPIGGPETLLRVKESVEQGFLVGLLGDRTVPGEKTLRCRFLGQETSLPVGPLALAALARCPVLLFFGLYRGGNRYDVHFETLTRTLVLDRGQRQAQLGHWAQRYADRLAHYARLAPDNWFNFYDYWEEDQP